MNSDLRKPVTFTPQTLQAIHDEVYRKDILTELYVEYFGEHQRARIEEKFAQTFDFVIPIDVLSYNLEKHFLNSEGYVGTAYKDVAKSARDLLFGSAGQNVLKLKDSRTRLSVGQLVMAMSEGEEEPFTMQNVFNFNLRKLVLSNNPPKEKGERYDEFMAKLFGIATEGFEGFESFESLTKKLISSVSRIEGVTINPNLTLSEIQKELSYLFDTGALRTSLDDQIQSFNKVFGTNFKNSNEALENPAYKKVINKFVEARIKFAEDYRGRSIQKDDVNYAHWSMFDKNPQLQSKYAEYPDGYDAAAFNSFRVSTLGHMVYFKRRGKSYPVIKVALDGRTAYSTAVHEAGHALQMVDDGNDCYTGFSKPVGNSFIYAAFNEFYNQFLTQRVTELAKNKPMPVIKSENASCYDDGTSLLSEFFNAYEEELKDNVIDNAFDFAINLFGADKFTALAMHCGSLRDTDASLLYGLKRDLDVSNLHELKQVLRNCPELYAEDNGMAAMEEENSERSKRVALASTIRAIDELTLPLILRKEQEKEF